MKCLEELEEKVLRLVQKNQEIQTQLDVMTKEKAALQEQSKQYETSLLKEVDTTQSLEKEKSAIVDSIEGLLNSIDAIEEKSH